jgi:hypothetical protein
VRQGNGLFDELACGLLKLRMELFEIALDAFHFRQARLGLLQELQHLLQRRPIFVL